MLGPAANAGGLSLQPRPWAFSASYHGGGQAWDWRISIRILTEKNASAANFAASSADISVNGIDSGRLEVGPKTIYWPDDCMSVSLLRILLRMFLCTHFEGCVSFRSIVPSTNMQFSAGDGPCELLRERLEEWQRCTLALFHRPHLQQYTRPLRRKHSQRSHARPLPPIGLSTSALCRTDRRGCPSRACVRSRRNRRRRGARSARRPGR